MNNHQANRISIHLWPGGFSRNLWMIADAARDQRILSLLQGLHLEHYCLYAGAPAPEIRSVAPYLVQLDPDDRGVHEFLNHAWGNSWGVLFKSADHRNTLRTHLRRLLVARDPAGRRLIFRYYDPRVLRTYLLACTQNDLNTFFGPIDRFFIEDEQPSWLLDYSIGDRGLTVTRLNLDAGSQITTERIAVDADPGRPQPDGPMLRIRTGQLKAFRQAGIRDSERRLLDHLFRYFPAPCRALGHAAVIKVIRCGKRRAAQYGITAERDVWAFVDVMFTLGLRFDEHPQMPWARDVLADANEAPSRRMERLRKRTICFLTQMAKRAKAHA